MSDRCDQEGRQIQKQLTITIDEAVYEGRHRVIGRGNISQFIERLVGPHVLPEQLDGRTNKAMADQLTTVSKRRMRDRAGRLSAKDRRTVERAIQTQLGLGPAT